MAGLIGQKIDRYEILENIGEGGMATVYKAFDTRLEREVAIKFIKRNAFPPDQLDMILKRFEREAKSLGRLSHPNIVGVIDYGEYDGAPYLVMTYLSGGTLKEKLGKPIPWREAVQLIIPIARALNYVHSHNIINRDVKPSNILMTENDHAMLTDFGLVKLFEGQDTQQLTASGAGIGTPDYMAPEQWTGEATSLSDMYSLGVVLYEMVTGHRPYISDTPAGVLLKQVNEPLPPPKQYIPDLPTNIESVLLKVLARRPEDRYPNMNAFANELQSILEGGQATATEVGTEKLREKMTGNKMKKEEIKQALGQVEQAQKENSQPTLISSQPAKSKQMLPFVISAIGAFALLIFCGGCWLTYSYFAIPTRQAPTALAFSSPVMPVTTSRAVSTQDFTPTATETPVPSTPTPEVQQFFTEKFQEGYEKNWSYFLRSGNESDFSLSSASDGLLFAITGKRVFSYLVYEPFDYDEVRVEAVVENRGVNTNSLTLFCRYSPEGGWYELNIYNSGLYNAYFTKPDSSGNLNYGLIAEGGSNAIKQGTAANIITLVCKKDTLSFFVNGTGIKTIPVPAYVPPGGKVGISVSSYNQVPVQALFSEVTISQP